MLKEKIKLFITKHNFWIISILLILSVLILIFFVKIENIKVLLQFSKDLSDTEIAVFGTLLGAIVGGVFTLIGTNLVNKKQLKAQTQIKRKNLIYKPLYDELVEIHFEYMAQNPYPNFININKTKCRFPSNSPQYTVWERIKRDTRYLETPMCLKKEMDALYKSIENYLESTADINTTIIKLLNDTLESELGTKCTIQNIGTVISNDVLSDNGENIFNHLCFGLNPPIDTDGSVKIRVSDIFYEKCKENEEIQAIKRKRELWFSQQKRTIDLLTILISFVTTKYEE